MKIAVAQINVHIGHFAQNEEKMRKAIQQAIEGKADIICFSEMATTGYPSGDLLEYRDYIDGSNQVLASLCSLSRDIGIIVGAPGRNLRSGGKPLYNSAYFMAEGEVRAIQHKSLLPTYDIFDERRYFEPASEWSVTEYKGERIALTICEDIWNVSSGVPIYPLHPLDHLVPERPDFIINLSASPFHYGSAERRIRVLRENIQKYHLPFFYINQCGGNTGILFDGGSLVLNDQGVIADEMPYFEEDLRIYDTKTIREVTVDREQPKHKTELIRKGLIMGIKDYFSKTGLKKAVLGLSGGLDSALVCTLAVQALGVENVLAVLMPGPYSTEHSQKDAEDLVHNLGIESLHLPIGEGYTAVNNSLLPAFGKRPFDVTEENIQARLRGLYLMALSNKLGYTLLNTSNKSEAAVGYGTLYGDMTGGLAVIADLYKSEAYELARHINREKEIIPIHTIIKPPSAELRPGQKDSDSLPDYKILDDILFRYIEKMQSPSEIFEAGYDRELVRKILRMVNRNEFKRHQSAPVLRISHRSLDAGRRMPIVARYPE